MNNETKPIKLTKNYAGHIRLDIIDKNNRDPYVFVGACSIYMGITLDGLNSNAIAGDIVYYAIENNIDDFNEIPDDVIREAFEAQHVATMAENIATGADAILTSCGL